MKLVPMLTFNGNAAEALDHYQAVFGGQADIAYYKDFPQEFGGQVPEDIANSIMHAGLTNDLFTIYVYDEFTDDPPARFNHAVIMMLTFNDFETAQTIFDQLAQEAIVKEPFASTSFSPGYGYLIDKFGLEWQFIVE